MSIGHTALARSSSVGRRRAGDECIPCPFVRDVFADEFFDGRIVAY